MGNELNAIVSSGLLLQLPKQYCKVREKGGRGSLLGYFVVSQLPMLSRYTLIGVTYISFNL